jgi:hypothetical protein
MVAPWTWLPRVNSPTCCVGRCRSVTLLGARPRRATWLTATSSSGSGVRRGEPPAAGGSPAGAGGAQLEQKTFRAAMGSGAGAARTGACGRARRRAGGAWGSAPATQPAAA